MTEIGGGWQPYVTSTEPASPNYWGHPVVAGAAVIAIAIAAWYVLFSALRPPAASESRPARVTIAAPPQPVASLPAPSTPSVVAESGAATVSDSARTSGSDSSDRPNRALHLSPFLQAHPWAAPTGGRFYYPTDCPATLRLSDLRFFKTQKAARAEGLVPAPSSGCQ